MKAEPSGMVEVRCPGVLRSRRRWMAAMAAASMVAVSACGSSTSPKAATTPTTSSSTGSSSATPTGTPYTIHAILALTGSASFLGTDEKAALMALQNQVNSTGGIDGHPLKFDVSDNQTTASVSVSLASPLISQVPVLIVGSITTVDRPVDALVTSTGPVIYDLSPGDHPTRGSYVYSSGNSTTNQTQAFINFAKTKGWTHIGALTSTDASGQDGWANIQKAVAGSNGAVTVTDHETFEPTAVSVTTQLTKIKATNPQALIVWTTGTPFSTVAKGMQQLDMESLPTMTTNGNLSYKELTGLANALPSQLYFPSSQFQFSPQQLSGDAATVVKNFQSAMEATGEAVPDEGNVLAWDPALLFVSALKKLGVNATAAQIHQYLASLTDFAGAGGTYNFTDPSVPDNRGLSIDSVFITQWNASAKNWTVASGAAGNPSS
ncbi:MAG: ABC transporter substrate-binding protein [Acidimicrobiales bacterium]